MSDLVDIDTLNFPRLLIFSFGDLYRPSLPRFAFIFLTFFFVFHFLSVSITIPLLIYFVTVSGEFPPQNSDCDNLTLLRYQGPSFAWHVIGEKSVVTLCKFRGYHSHCHFFKMQTLPIISVIRYL